jgi:hypothetical protein
MVWRVDSDRSLRNVSAMDSRYSWSRCVHVSVCQPLSVHSNTHIALQYQIVHQVDSVGHRLFLPALAARRVGKLDRLAIAKEAPRKQQVVDVCRCCFEAVRFHGRGRGLAMSRNSRCRSCCLFTLLQLGPPSTLATRTSLFPTRPD